MWSAVTCHRFCAGRLVAQLRRVQRLKRGQGIRVGESDGDKSPTESGDKSPHCYEERQVGICAERTFFLSLKASCLFSFPADSERQNVFLATAAAGGRCSSCYPCSAPQGRHHLTHAVTARKRARPISKAGRCQPKCGSGRAPFQNLSNSFVHRLTWVH